MFKICKFSLFSSQSTKDLDDDESSELACTSKLQKWHKKGGGANIAPQPVMEVEVNKTKLDETAVRSGVKPLVYDVRANAFGNKPNATNGLMNRNIGLQHLNSI